MGDLGGRYAAYASRLVAAVLATPGDSSAELRRAVAARAARLGTISLPASPPDPLSRRERGNDVPAPLATYVDKVAQHAYKVTDEDIAALQRSGHSDDALFEVTVAAALGAALGRLERGLAALSSPPDLLSATRREGTVETR